MFGFKKKKKSKKNKRAFEAASKKDRLSSWLTPTSRSVNAETDGTLSLLRARSRDLVVNNGYSADAVDTWVSNVIGSGIRPLTKTATPFDKKLKEWLEDPKLFDVAGRLNYFQMQELMFKSIVRDGEIVIRRRFSASNARNGQIPIKLQIMEADHLNDNLLSIDSKITQGIETDDDGKIVNYHLSKFHPGDSGIRNNFNIETVQVAADEILHPMRFDRAGQLRGIPWPTPSIIRMRDIDEYEDAELLRQKIAACFTAFIKKEAPNTINILGSTEQDETDLPEKLIPGNIEILRPGEDIVIPQPPSKEGYDIFLKQNLRGAAKGWGIPYVIFADDLSEVNYSSMRGGLLQFFKKVNRYQKNIAIQQFCNPVIMWAQEFGELAGIAGAKESVIEHVVPKKDIIDPAKEIPATISGIRAGLYTLTEAIAEQGKDPDKHFEQLKGDKTKIDALGLVLDSDPSQTQKNGAMQSDEPDTEENTTSDKE